MSPYRKSAQPSGVTLRDNIGGPVSVEALMYGGTAGDAPRVAIALMGGSGAPYLLATPAEARVLAAAIVSAADEAEAHDAKARCPSCGGSGFLPLEIFPPMPCPKGCKVPT